MQRSQKPRSRGATQMSRAGSLTLVHMTTASYEKKAARPARPCTTDFTRGGEQNGGQNDNLLRMRWQGWLWPRWPWCRNPRSLLSVQLHGRRARLVALGGGFGRPQQGFSLSRGYSSVVERSPDPREVGGSNPSIPTRSI